MNLGDYSVAMKVLKASCTMNSCDNGSGTYLNPLAYCYEQLPCFVDRVDDSTVEYRIIREYLTKTAAEENWGKIRVGIFKVSMKETGDNNNSLTKFEKFEGQRRMLWHGTG